MHCSHFLELNLTCSKKSQNYALPKKNSHHYVIQDCHSMFLRLLAIVVVAYILTASILLTSLPLVVSAILCMHATSDLQD